MKQLNFMPHQTKVLHDTEHFDRVAYYLDMGLGKTFIGAEKMYELNNGVNLVICQKSKIDDWVQHFTDYYPDCKVYNLTKKSQAITFMNLVQYYNGRYGHGYTVKLPHYNSSQFSYCIQQERK